MKKLLLLALCLLFPSYAIAENYDSNQNQQVNVINTSIPVTQSGAWSLGILAGSAVIGHVITDSGSTTAVTGNVATTAADASNVTLGAKADAKSTATDTTAITVMQVLKQISASVQAPPSQAVTNAGTFATQSAATEADGANVTLGAKADAKSTATDTTAITVMQVLKQISASVQAPPSQAVTNAGTFATQSAITAASSSVASGAYASGSVSDGAVVTLGAKADAKSTATDTTAVTAMQVLKQISASVQAPPSQAVTNAGTFAVQAADAGDVASGSTDSGNPVKVGYLAKTSLPTAVTDAQRVNAMADKFGRPVVLTNSIRDLTAMQATTITASTGSTTIVTAGATGVYDDIVGLTISNSSATATLVTIGDGTLSLIISVPANGGITVPISTPWPETSTATAWTATCGTSVSSIYIIVTFVKNK